MKTKYSNRAILKYYFVFLKRSVSRIIVSGEDSHKMLVISCFYFLRGKRCLIVYKTRVNHSPKAEMRYCEISTEILSLYFGLAVFRLFEARVPEFKGTVSSDF
jgi:hypothetical protein